MSGHFDNILNSNINRRIAVASFWSLGGAVISRGLMLLASVIIARILTQTEYGELGIIRSTINMFTVFAGFGLGLTATKYVAQFRDTNKLKAGKIIALSSIFAFIIGLIIALIIVFNAEFIALYSLNASHLQWELKIGAVILFFSSLNGVQTGILAGFEAFKTIAKINLIAGILSFPTLIGFSYFWGVTGAVIGFGSNFLLLYILNFLSVRKIATKENVPIKFFNSWEEWRVLYKFSLPAVLSGLLVSPTLWFCSTMLIKQPSGYEELAIFEAANQWKNTILFIPAAIAPIVLPLIANTSKSQFKRVINLNIKINVIISLPVAIILSLLSSKIMMAYGMEYEKGQPVLIILSVSTILISINNVIGQAIAGKGKMWIGFFLNMIWSISILSATYMFLDNNLGGKGLALSILISYFIHTILQFTVAKKLLK